MKGNIFLFFLFLYKQTLMKCLSFDVHVNDTFCLQTIVNKLSDFIVNDWAKKILLGGQRIQRNFVNLNFVESWNETKYYTLDRFLIIISYTSWATRALTESATRLPPPPALL
jgi:hypothetical protein